MLEYLTMATTRKHIKSVALILLLVIAGSVGVGILVVGAGVVVITLMSEGVHSELTKVENK